MKNTLPFLAASASTLALLLSTAAYANETDSLDIITPEEEAAMMAEMSKDELESLRSGGDSTEVKASAIAQPEELSDAAKKPAEEVAEHVAQEMSKEGATEPVDMFKEDAEVITPEEEASMMKAMKDDELRALGAQENEAALAVEAKEAADKPPLAEVKEEEIEDITMDEGEEQSMAMVEEEIQYKLPAYQLKGFVADDALREALEAAYAGNPNLHAQRKAYQAAVEQVPQAIAGALPSATAGYAKGRQRTRSAGSVWNSSDSELRSLTLTQPLFRGGTTYANTKLARHNVDVASSRLIQSEQSVLLQAITAYSDVVRAQAILRLSEKTRDVLARQLRAAQQRFDVGEDTRTDVAQSRSRLALAKSDVTNSKGQLEAARAVFTEVIGNAPLTVKALKKMPPMPETQESFIEQAMDASPLVQEARSLKEASDYAIDANVGTLLPSINLEASMTRQEGTGAFGNTDFDQDEVQISASLPLYQGGARYSRVRQAKETYHQRRYELQDRENQVRRQAVSAWEDLQAAKATIVSNQAAIKAANIALDGVRQEQQYGARTTLDVLDAERELFNAEVQLVISERNRTVAAYSVLAVLGQLTAENMGLDVSLYDAEGYYDDTEYQIIGF